MVEAGVDPSQRAMEQADPVALIPLPSTPMPPPSLLAILIATCHGPATIHGCPSLRKRESL